jgi:Bacterial PH domain
MVQRQGPLVASEAANACASFCPAAPTTVPAAICTNAFTMAVGSCDYVKTARSPKVLFASKRIFAILWLFLAILILSQFWNFEKSPVMASLLTFFFGLGFSYLSFQLFTNRYRLEISETGLTIMDFFQTRTIRWADIKTIRAGWSCGDDYPIPFNKRLFVTYRKESRDRVETIWPLWFGMNADQMVTTILPFCANYPRLIETLRSDSKNGANV